MMGKWADLRDKIKQNDSRRLEDMDSFYSAGATIENMLALANARAVDALAALSVILTHMDDQGTAPVGQEHIQKEEAK